MRHAEYNIQVACVTWFRLQYPHHLIYHVPNGERRDAVTGARLKRSGVVAGVPDLVIPYANGKHSHLYIELKAGSSGRVSANQKHVIEQLKEGGACVAVCRSVDDFIDTVRAYFSE